MTPAHRRPPSEPARIRDRLRPRDGAILPAAWGRGNELVAPVHNRMPAMRSRPDGAAWLDTKEAGASEALAVLRRYPAAEMELRPVSRAVNLPSADGPALIEPL